VTRPIRAFVSRPALEHNLGVARRHAGDARVWAVVKANAYGHGLLRAARAFDSADGFALLDLDEAAKLRDAGHEKPILLLEGFFGYDDLLLVAEYRLTPAIHSLWQVELLEAADLPMTIPVFVKLNTGMNRLGFTPEQFTQAIGRLKRCRAVSGITLMTHFADADGKRGVAGQLERFRAASGGLDFPVCVANSAALLRYPETACDWVRPGIMLYGCSPFADVTAETLGLTPAMTLSSEIIAVRDLQTGDEVGYGGTFRAARPMRVGVVACGYADGYPRHAPSGTPVLIAGKRAATVGRVSMDMLTVDLSAHGDFGVGTRVTLWGNGLSADEVARHAGTVSYELLCALAQRVPVIET
jgi:alanine racemase